MSAIAWTGLITLLVVAVVIDVRSRRIPNALSVAAILVALMLQGFAGSGDGFFTSGTVGGQGLPKAGAATLVALVVGMLLWRLRLFGAGDAKLLAAAAAWLGWGGVIPLYGFTLVAGGAMALSWYLLFNLSLWAGRDFGVTDRRVPYSLAVAVGAVATALTLQSGVITSAYI